MRRPIASRRDRHFDASYYQRYYLDPETAVVTPEIQRNEVAFVIAFCREIGLEVSRFADVGAGTGWWAEEFARQYPDCGVIETFDSSSAACELYGHRLVPVEKLAGRAADLVVCRDVLRYVPDREIGRAFSALGRKCRGVLYVQAITSDDEIDEEASDMAGRFRSAAFYRRRFKAEGFRDCGMGLFVSKRLREFVPWALESR